MSSTTTISNREKLTPNPLVLKSESPEGLDDLESGLELSLNPVGRLESTLAFDAATNYWRVLRCKMTEAALINYEITQFRAMPDQLPAGEPSFVMRALEAGLACAGSIAQSDILNFIARAESRYQRNAERSVRLILALQKHRARNTAASPSEQSAQPPAEQTPAKPVKEN